MGTFSFLQLPRELRDRIYIAYFTTPDHTYAFDFFSKKLRKSDGSSIDVALPATCKAIAKETRGMAFGINTITFYTIYSDELRALAGRFNQIFHDRYIRLKSGFQELAYFMDHTKMREVTNRHPILIPTIKQFNVNLRDNDLADSYINYWIDTPSRGYYASLDALRSYLESLSPDDPLTSSIMFPPNLEDFLEDLKTLVAVDMNPWDIPTESELYEAHGALSIDYGKYRFSAASAAIHFLRSAPEIRCHIRNILICEDHTSVAFPECHALGLIPFCQENSALRITRRASLWNNIFLDDMDAIVWQWRLSSLCNVNTTAPIIKDRLPMDSMTKVLAAWISEAGILSSAGMTTGQYTFIMDGDPMPEEASRVFSHIQRAAFLQDVVTKAAKPAGRRYSYFHRTLDHFLYDDFPKLLGDLVNDHESGIIRCNFDPGSRLWSVDEVLETHPDWDSRDWENDLHDWPGNLEDMTIPGFVTMYLENNMSESYLEKYPNGPPRHSDSNPPDWEEVCWSEEDDDNEENDAAETDAHEADV